VGALKRARANVWEAVPLISALRKLLCTTTATSHHRIVAMPFRVLQQAGSTYVNITNDRPCQSDQTSGVVIQLE
jgi:hypothetical protein